MFLQAYLISLPVKIITCFFYLLLHGIGFFTYHLRLYLGLAVYDHSEDLINRALLYSVIAVLIFLLSYSFGKRFIHIKIYSFSNVRFKKLFNDSRTKWILLLFGDMFVYRSFMGLDGKHSHFDRELPPIGTGRSRQRAPVLSKLLAEALSICRCCILSFVLKTVIPAFFLDFCPIYYKPLSVEYGQRRLNEISSFDMDRLFCLH